MNSPSEALKASIQLAMVGEITANMAAITCGIEDCVIRVRCSCFDGPTDEDRERFSFMAGEVIADFPEPYTINEEIVGLNDQEPDCFDFWAFKRADVNPKLR